MIATFAGKNGPESVELAKDKKSGLYIRPGSSDQTMLREACFRDYSTVYCKDHVCLDLGGNVGGFILKAAIEEAHSVISYEPEPRNFDIMSLNATEVRLRYPLMGLIDLNQAAVSDVTGTFDLTISPGSNSPCSASLTTKVKGNRYTVPVQVDAIKDVLAKHRPTLIKMDIEGAEYAVLREKMPAHVQEMAIEFHGFTKKNRALMHENIAKLKQDGWKFIDERSKKIFNVVSLITVHIKR